MKTMLLMLLPICLLVSSCASLGAKLTGKQPSNPGVETKYTFGSKVLYHDVVTQNADGSFDFVSQNRGVAYFRSAKWMEEKMTKIAERKGWSDEELKRDLMTRPKGGDLAISVSNGSFPVTPWRWSYEVKTPEGELIEIGDWKTQPVKSSAKYPTLLHVKVQKAVTGPFVIELLYQGKVATVFEIFPDDMS